MIVLWSITEIQQKSEKPGGKKIIILHWKICHDGHDDLGQYGLTFKLSSNRGGSWEIIQEKKSV